MRSTVLLHTWISDFSPLNSGDSLDLTGVGATKIDGYDYKTGEQIVSGVSLEQVRTLISNVLNVSWCPSRVICTYASNKHTVLGGDSGGGIYRNGKLVGNLMGILERNAMAMANMVVMLDRHFISQNLDADSHRLQVEFCLKSIEELNRKSKDRSYNVSIVGMHAKLSDFSTFRAIASSCIFSRMAFERAQNLIIRVEVVENLKVIGTYFHSQELPDNGIQDPINNSLEGGDGDNKYSMHFSLKSIFV
jgi:hypothetical protein